MSCVTYKKVEQPGIFIVLTVLMCGSYVGRHAYETRLRFGET